MNSSPSHPLLDFWNFLRRPLAERMSAGIGQKLTFVVLIVALDILLSVATSPWISSSKPADTPSKASKRSSTP